MTFIEILEPNIHYPVYKIEEYYRTPSVFSRFQDMVSNPIPRSVFLRRNGEYEVVLEPYTGNRPSYIKVGLNG